MAIRAHWMQHKAAPTLRELVIATMPDWGVRARATVREHIVNLYEKKFLGKIDVASNQPWWVPSEECRAMDRVPELIEIARRAACTDALAKMVVEYIEQTPYATE